MDAPTSAPAVAIACRSPAPRARPAQPGVLHARRDRALRAPAREPRQTGRHMATRVQPTLKLLLCIMRQQPFAAVCWSVSSDERSSCPVLMLVLPEQAALGQVARWDKWRVRWRRCDLSRFRFGVRDARVRTKGALGPVARGCGQLADQRLAGRLPDALAHPVEDLACARGAGCLAHRAHPGCCVTMLAPSRATPARALCCRPRCCAAGHAGHADA